MSRAEARPTQISVRAYQVGFGDSVLLTFRYAENVEGRDERHVLFDFGSTQWPDEGEFSYQSIVSDLVERTKGKLDVLVVTHRHKDHIAGFAQDQAAAEFAKLKPSLVIRPWTDDPKAAADATEPGLVDEGSFRFASSVSSAQEFAATVHRTIKDHGMRLDRSTLRGELALMAFEEVANKEAIERIDQLAEAASHGARYVHARADVKIEELIPGVRARALGPPTIEQWPQMATQKTDDEEYWLRLKRMLNFSLERPGVRTLDAAAESTGLGPGPARSLVELMRNEYAHSLLRIVRTVDDTLNNTSVILFFETGTRRLLFPGDAQIENWSYALKDESTAELREGLDQVDLYKVGHHGSRNATPKSLVHLWQTGGRPVASIMSTKPKVHGETPETAVPQDKLIEALEGVGALHRTDTLPETASYLELTASTSDDQPFKAS